MPVCINPCHFAKRCNHSPAYNNRYNFPRDLTPIEDMRLLWLPYISLLRKIFTEFTCPEHLDQLVEVIRLINGHAYQRRLLNAHQNKLFSFHSLYSVCARKFLTSRHLATVSMENEMKIVSRNFSLDKFEFNYCCCVHFLAASFLNCHFSTKKFPKVSCSICLCMT